MTTEKPQALTEQAITVAVEKAELNQTPTLSEMFGKKIYELDFPYRLADGRTLTKVTMARRATVNDAKQARRIAGNDETMYEQALMAMCSDDGLIAEDFGGMDLSDYGKIQNHFRGKSARG